MRSYHRASLRVQLTPKSRLSNRAGPSVSVTGIDPSSIERDGRPAFVPRTTGRRHEMARTAGASNPHVTSWTPTSLQVEKPTTGTLSRWRHGFESRWGYLGERIVGASSPPWSTCRHGLSGHTKAQVNRAEEAAPPVTRAAFVPQTTSPRHGAVSRLRPSAGLSRYPHVRVMQAFT